MKEKILDFFKGIAIGISNVIPGFSGGTMAVILKVYDKFIDAFAHFFKNPIRVIKSIWALALGLVVGILIAIIAIVKLLENFPIPTMLFFVGLIIGSIPSIFKSASKEKLKIKDIVVCILCAVLITVIPLIPGAKDATSDVNIKTMIIMLVMGIICAGAMIIPGVSGSLVLMAFGYYTYLMENLDFFIDVVRNMSFTGSLDSILICLSFGIGAIIGLVFVSKLIEFLLKKYSQTVYYGILGLLIASPFAIIYAVLVIEKDYSEAVNKSTFISWIVGLILMAISAFLAGYMSLLNEKKEEKNHGNETNC